MDYSSLRDMELDNSVVECWIYLKTHFQRHCRYTEKGTPHVTAVKKSGKLPLLCTKIKIIRLSLVDSKYL